MTLHILRAAPVYDELRAAMQALYTAERTAGDPTAAITYQHAQHIVQRAITAIGEQAMVNTKGEGKS